MWRDLLFRLRALLRRRLVETDLDDELRFHRERQLDAYRRAGLPPAEARRRLALQFGGLDQVKEECRNVRGVTLVEHLIQDVRYGVRSLFKAPAFTVVSVLTLALGLGANTAIFSVVYGVLLRPLPFADPSKLVVLHETTPQVGTVSVSIPNFLDWRADSRTFAAMSVVVDLDVDLAGVSQPENISAQAVSSNYLSLLGARPLFGRDFEPAEDRPGTDPVALLSYGLWQTHFGGDRDVTGRTISLNGRPVTIVGVLPREFRSTDPASLYEPVGAWLTGNDDAMDRGNRGDTIVVGRIARGVTLDRARTEMEGIAARLAAAYPNTNARFGVELRSIRDVLVGDVRPALWVLFGAVLCVLLIACANVANLCLIRGASRAREMALRIAIGAGRRRIVAQLLVEGALLACAGGALGIGLALAGLHGLTGLIPADSLGGATVTLNGAVLAFAAATVIVATLIFGLAPAFHAARTSVQADLKDAGRAGSTGRQQRRWRAVLAVAEIALAIVLLVGAGLMTRSLARLLSVDPGIRTDGVLTVGMTLRSQRYQTDETRQLFWQQILDDAGRLPGVQAVALGTGVPLTNGHSRTDISIEGLSFQTGGLPHPDVHIVTPGYAAALGLHLLNGRFFTDADTDRSSPVGVVNRTVAERYFAGTNPVGRHFAFGRPASGRAPAWIAIVGVVEDTRLYGLDNPSRLEVYVPLPQRVRGEMTMILKAASDPAGLVPSIRRLVASIDPDLPLWGVETMDDLRNESVSTRRVTFVLLSLFSALALGLATIGIYGVMSYSVSQRTAELGIRLALGAPRAGVLTMIVRQGLVLAAAGIGVGAALALGVARLMRGLLFAVSASDPVTFVTVAGGVAVVAAIACAVPGWRALRVDPLIALRRE